MAGGTMLWLRWWMSPFHVYFCGSVSVWLKINNLGGKCRWLLRKGWLCSTFTVTNACCTKLGMSPKASSMYSGLMSSSLDKLNCSVVQCV
ncbi:hypothetical protein LINGRAHAP2_LOCUS9185 [Linum grandiflorum]